MPVVLSRNAMNFRFATMCEKALISALRERCPRSPQRRWIFASKCFFINDIPEYFQDSF